VYPKSRSETRRSARGACGSTEERHTDDGPIDLRFRGELVCKALQLIKLTLDERVARHRMVGLGLGASGSTEERHTEDGPIDLAHDSRVLRDQICTA